MNFMSYNLHFHRQLRKIMNSYSCFKFSFKSWSIVFFGSDNFSLNSLEKLHNQIELKLIRSLEVVTTNNATPVYRYAFSNNIKVYTWPPTLSGTYDLGVIVSFGKFIPKKMLDQFSLGIINIHASLLPRWRGGMPIVHTLKNGDTTSGITVIKINSDKFDTGEVILQKFCSVGRNELFPSLQKKLSELGSECLLEVFHTMPDCLEKCEPQSNKNVTYAPILKGDSAVVKWTEMTAAEVYNLYRAFFGKDSEKETPGSVRYNKLNQCLLVQCKDKPIRLCTVSINNKLYTAYGYYRGYLTQKSRSPKFDT